MAQVYNTGAVFVYAGLGSQGSAVFVGTGERAPKQRLMRGWEPVFNDLAGTQDPFEELYEGQWAFVMVRLTRWNQFAVDQMQSTPFALGNAQQPGTDLVGDVGAAMMTEGALYPLWLLYDYGASGRAPQAAMSTMPPGRHYFGVKLESPDDNTTGTQANSLDLVWKAKRIYNYNTGNFSLYDANVTGLPLPNWTMSDERTFRYHNGAAEVHGDPAALRRGLIVATGGRVNALLRDYYGVRPGLTGDALDGAQAACAAAGNVLIPAVRHVFGMAPFDRGTGLGVTDDDCDRVLCDFQNYLAGVKKKPVTTPSTAPSSAPASSLSTPTTVSA